MKRPCSQPKNPSSFLCSSVLNAFSAPSAAVLCALCGLRFFLTHKPLKTLPALTPLHHQRRNGCHPVIHQTVTLQALPRISLRHMVGGFRSLEIVHVATATFGRQSLPVERAHRPHLVAGIAIHHRVRPNQREAILVLINVVNGDLPPGIPMACIALRRIFAAMNIRVAILALVACFREYKISVTIYAPDFRVQPAQRKSCLAMFKLRHRANRLPALRCVTVFARDGQGAVRTTGLLGYTGSLAGCIGTRIVFPRKHSQMQNHHQLRNE